MVIVGASGCHECLEFATSNIVPVTPRATRLERIIHSLEEARSANQYNAVASFLRYSPVNSEAGPNI